MQSSFSSSAFAELQNPLPAGAILYLTTAPSCRSATLLKTNTAFKFITEQHADQIAAILAEVGAGLKVTRSAGIEKPAPDFGLLSQTADSRLARSGPTLEVRQIKFPLPHRWGELHLSNNCGPLSAHFQASRPLNFKLSQLTLTQCRIPCTPRECATS
jgi:hypothetical protein